MAAHFAAAFAAHFAAAFAAYFDFHFHLAHFTHFARASGPAAAGLRRRRRRQRGLKKGKNKFKIWNSVLLVGKIKRFYFYRYAGAARRRESKSANHFEQKM